MNISVSAPPESCKECPRQQDSICHILNYDGRQIMAGLRSGYGVARPKRMMVREGKVATEAFRILSGWAIRFKASANGRRRILAILLPGDFLIPGSIHDCSAPPNYSVQALTDVGFCVFPMNEIVGILSGERGAVCDDLADLRSRSSGTDDRIALPDGRSAKGRVAGFATDLFERLRQQEPLLDLEFAFPLRIADIADTLDLSPAQARRALIALREDGLLEISDGKMKIFDRERLCELAAPVARIPSAGAEASPAAFAVRGPARKIT